MPRRLEFSPTSQIQFRTISAHETEDECTKTQKHQFLFRPLVPPFSLPLFVYYFPNTRAVWQDETASKRPGRCSYHLRRCCNLLKVRPWWQLSSAASPIGDNANMGVGVVLALDTVDTGFGAREIDSVLVVRESIVEHHDEWTL
jgi:hypothetical protein